MKLLGFRADCDLFGQDLATVFHDNMNSLRAIVRPAGGGCCRVNRADANDLHAMPPIGAVGNDRAVPVFRRRLVPAVKVVDVVKGRSRAGSLGALRSE